MCHLANFLSVVEHGVLASLLKRKFRSIKLMMTMTMTIPMGRDSAPTGIEPFEVLVTLFVILLALLCLCRNVLSCGPRVVIMYLVSCNKSMWSI